MAEILPFRAWRYDLGQVGDLSDVICPPYDVIDPAFQDALYKKHPCNVIRMEYNREEPGDASPDDRYPRAVSFLRRWQQDGTLTRDREDALYVYHQIFTWEGQTHTRKGFMARIRLERFGEGKVFPHEQTLSGPKADRFKLLTATETNLSPIFGLFPDQDNAAQDLLEQAILTMTAVEATDHLGVLHRLWTVTDHAVIEKVRNILRDKPVFIADGHHRYETANNYRDGLKKDGKLLDSESGPNFALMMFVGMSDPGLVILPTHRLVSGLPAMTANDLAAALSSHLEINQIGQGTAAAQEAWEQIEMDGRQGMFGFGTAADGVWSIGTVKDASPMAQLAADQSQAWRELGVSLLHKLVIDYLLKQKYPEANPQFKYVHLLSETTDAIDKRECQLACLVPPAQISHVEEIAAKLEKMPPKSTYFYPKLLTGLVFNSVSQTR